MTVAPGTRFGCYDVLAPLGAGGMGEVYRARDLTLKRDVALKLLPPSFVNNADRMARFQREAEVLASLNHPNIAHIFGIVESGEIRALAMELAEGESPRGPMPFEDAWKIASQIAEALSYAHDHGVIHRDLKPANVKVTPEGTVKLLDFGLAKAVTPEREVSPGSNQADSPTITVGATEAGVILGTAAYMSPEQARGKQVDKRADIWAFGVLLYELLTGMHPFEGEDIGQTLAAVITQEPDLDRVPARTRELLRSCLEKDPKRRLRDIGDAARLLAVPPYLPVRRPRRILPWIPGAVLLLVMGTAAGWLLHTRLAPEPQVLRLEIQPPEGGRFASDAMASGLAMSPDGSRLAFVASGKDGINRLWVRTLSGGPVQQLSGTDDARYPFWSPDGNTIAFFNAKTLMRIDLNGSALQAITDTSSGRGGVWLPDGRIVFGSYGTPLRIVPAAGGASTPLVAGAEGWRGQLWPQALPGGRLMYFEQHSGDRGENAVFVVSLDKPRVTSRLMSVTECPLYIPSGPRLDYLLSQRGSAMVAQAIDRATLQLRGTATVIADPVSSGGIEGQIYATASKQGPLVYSSVPRLTQFTWFDRAGRALGTVGVPGGYHFGPFRISPNGRTIAAAIDRPGGAQMGLLEVERGVFNGFPITAGNNSFPAWAPDSMVLAYGRTIVDLPNSSTIAGLVGPWDWSPDGREVLRRNLIQGVRNEILVQPMKPDRTPDGAPGPYTDGMNARFSPDGRWVAFSSDETGDSEVYFASFPSPLRKTRISTRGGDFPVWSSNGREMYYVQPGNILMAVSLKISGSTVQPAAPKELFVLPVSETPTYPFDVAKDGRFLVRADVPQASNALTAIVHWQALIK
jgi:serine/threonine protein kinase